MVDTIEFYNYLISKNLDTFYGVPDSLLKDICSYITSQTLPEKHIITANEGNAVALASGKFIATGLPAVVYMQNSGLGNIVNPLISLVDEEVYRIPMLFLIGWRGEPGIHDEPQHKKQGKITLSLLDTLGVKYEILSDDYKNQLDIAIDYMNSESKPFALVIKKNTFSKVPFNIVGNQLTLTREEALEILLDKIDKKSIIVSTTGKTSREVFEIRERNNDTHERDFLTVGSMGHTSSIALGISLFTDKKVYCVDGDGSLLMHLGSLGIAAMNSKDNFKYIIINNGSHESVGGQPTICFDIDLKSILSGLGFKKIYEVTSIDEIKDVFEKFDNNALSALIIKVKQGSRDNLGRPTTTPLENKLALMSFIRKGFKQ